MPALDGWPSPRPPRGDRETEPGVQHDSSCLRGLRAANKLRGGPFFSVVSRWEGALDLTRARKVLSGEIAFVPEPEERTEQAVPVEQVEPGVPGALVKAEVQGATEAAERTG